MSLKSLGIAALAAVATLAVANVGSVSADTTTKINAPRSASQSSQGFMYTVSVAVTTADVSSSSTTAGEAQLAHCNLVSAPCAANSLDK